MENYLNMAIGFSTLAILVGVIYRVMQDDIRNLKNHKVDKELCQKQHNSLDIELREQKKMLIEIIEKLEQLRGGLERWNK